MQKRLLTVLICLQLAIATFAAQLTATLQSGDQITPFYGTNALVDAYKAAVNGDVITLSPGQFNSTTIEKGIAIIGTYAFSDDSSKSTRLNNFTVIADNVSLEGIYVSALTIKGADNLTIRRSDIVSLKNTENDTDKYHDNTIITDSRIGSYEAMSLSKNTVLKNCCINYFYSSGGINESANPALIENCNIPVFACFSNSNFYRQPYAIYRNCFLGLYNHCIIPDIPVLNLNSPSEFHSIVFYQNFYAASTSSNAKAWTINYNSCRYENTKISGTKYGIGLSLSDCNLYDSFSSFTAGNLTVGPSDVKQEPAIPKITSSAIDTETDAEGNLHVKITAVARD